MDFCLPRISECLKALASRFFERISVEGREGFVSMCFVV